MAKGKRHEAIDDVLKAAVGDDLSAIKKLIGANVEGIARLIDKPASTLYACANDADEGAYLSIHDVPRLHRAGSAVSIMRALADACGYRLAPKDAATPVDHPETVRAVTLTAMREAGRLAGEVVDALGDGYLDDKEKRAIYEICAALEGQVSRVRSVVGASKYEGEAEPVDDDRH